MKKVDKQNMYYTIKENTIENFNDPDNIAIFTNIYENKFWETTEIIVIYIVGLLEVVPQ